MDRRTAGSSSTKTTCGFSVARGAVEFIWLFRSFDGFAMPSADETVAT
jgi:hypothetical protein